MRTRTKILLAVVALIFCVIAVRYCMEKKNKPQIESGNISYDGFGGADALWKKGVLIGKDNQFIFESRYRSGLKYRNPDMKEPIWLCSVPDCTHNSEECEAIFGFDFVPEYMCCKENQLIVAGVTGTSLKVYRMDMDGSNHELVAQHTLIEQPYNAIDQWNSCAYGSKLYISASLIDTSQQKVIEDGTVTDVKANVRIYCLNLEDFGMEKIYTAPQDYYNSYITLQYLFDDILYFDYVGYFKPYEEIYNTENGELKNKNIKDEGPEEVHAFSLKDGEDQLVKDRQVNDFKGECDGKYYYVYRKDIYYTGDILIENKERLTKNQIHIKELEGKCITYYDVVPLREGIVVIGEEDEEEAGSMLFYDESGNLIRQIDKCNKYVIGEYDNLYLLSDSIFTQCSGYITKEDIELVDKKCVELDVNEYK